MSCSTLVSNRLLIAALLAVALLLSLGNGLPVLDSHGTGFSPRSHNAFVPFQESDCCIHWRTPARSSENDFGARLPSNPVGLRLTPCSFIPHQPVVISSDQDFINQGWSGSGIADDPYRIENLEIVAETGNCIDIRSTTAYFCVQQCNLTGNSRGYGVYLEEVVNAILNNNTCALSACGIRAYGSQQSQIARNTCWNTVDGIRLVLCQSVNVTDNVCWHVSATGIRLYESDTISAAGNLCDGGQCGIVVYGGDSNDVSHNTCVENSVAGLVLNATLMNSATQNRCDWNTVGIYLQDASGGSVTQNTCDHNTEAGAFMLHSQSNNVVNNVFRGNKRGIHLTTSTSNYIADNLLEGNAESGVYLYLSQSNRVDVNTICGSVYGIYAVASLDSAMTINTLSNNTRAGILLVESGMGAIDFNTFLGSGLELQGELNLAQQEVIGNTVNGAPLLYVQNERRFGVPSGAGQIILLQCRSVMIEHQNLSSTSIGLLILQSSEVTVEGCLFGQNSRSGVEVWQSQAIVFHNNSFLGNGECGLVLHSDSSGNSIRENLFGDDAIHNALDDGLLNIFDRNFWSDYVGFDTNLDGLGDDPYSISGRAMNRDWNPLMAPLGAPSPARLPRWILTVATAAVANSLIVIFGLSIFFRHRKRR
jgi:parallel beta-helix repeat protein